jgi:putative protease
MSNHRLGRVTHYFDHLHVATLALEEPIRVGDWLHFCGHTTDFVQQVVSLQIEHQPVAEAAPGQDVAVKVSDHVRVHDAVYRITVDEAREFEETQALERPW